MKARINTAKTLSLYYPPSSTLDTPRVLVYDSDDTLVTTILLTPSSTFANLYIADTTYTFTQVGEYTLKYQEVVATVYTTIYTEDLQVGTDPTSDVVLSATVGATRVLDDSVVGDIVSTVQCVVLDADDAVVETVAAAYSASESGYVADLSPISTEGDYFLLWDDDGTYVFVEQVLGLTPKSYEQVTLEAYETAGSQAVPHTSTKVLFSRQSDMFPVAQDITDSNGLVSVVLPPDTYIASLDKSGTVFSRNNVKLEVVDTSIYEGSNDFRYETDAYTPTFDPDVSAVATATLYADLYDFMGTPMRDTEILVSLAQGPENLSGTAVFGTSQVFKTDKNGHVEFDLVQGAVVTVTIMSHSVRKTVTVPSGDDALTPTNLLDLMSAAPDVFDIVVVDIPAAPRRSI